MWEAEWPPNRRRRLWRSHWVRRGERGRLQRGQSVGSVRERGLGLWDWLRSAVPQGHWERAFDGNRRDEHHAQATRGGGEGDTEAGGPQNLSPAPRSGGNHGEMGGGPGFLEPGAGFAPISRSPRGRVACSLGLHCCCWLAFSTFLSENDHYPHFPREAPGPPETLAVGGQTRIESPVRGP